MISLSVQRAEFEAAFGLIRSLATPLPGEEAVLSFDGERLCIKLAGMGVAPAAQGCWPGQARVGASVMLALANVPPAGEVIKFRIADGELRVGTTIAACAWQTERSDPIVLAENASRAEILSLPLRYETAEVEASGYAETLKEAETWRSAQIGLALDSLATLGVTREDLAAVVGEALQRSVEPSAPPEQNGGRPPNMSNPQPNPTRLSKLPERIPKWTLVNTWEARTPEGGDCLVVLLKDEQEIERAFYLREQDAGLLLIALAEVSPSAVSLVAVERESQTQLCRRIAELEEVIRQARAILEREVR